MLEEFLSHYVPNQGGVILIGVLIAFLVCGDLENLRSRRNLVLTALLILAPMFVDLISAKPWRMAPTFAVIYLLTAGYAFWSYRLSRGSWTADLTPRIGTPGLRTILIFVLLIDALVVFGRAPDDAGYYTNLGARRWLETGNLPYGDPLLKGPGTPAHGAAATYGPLLLAAHIPFQFLVGAEWNSADATPADPSYVRPPDLATQLTCFAFFLVGIFALFSVVNLMVGPGLGYSAAILYASSPYVLTLGGVTHMSGGLVYISHIAPSAMTVLAFLYVGRPFLSGALLACAAGLLYYPAFLFPAWVGWRYWRKEGFVAFVAGFATLGALISLLVVVGTEAPDPVTAVKYFLESTLEHQEGASGDQYGLSSFSFWGNHPRLRGIFHEPVVGSGSLFKPTFFAYISLVLGAFFLAKGRSWAQLAALSAMLTAALQLWKSHASGSYVEWYYPFLLIGIMGAASTAKINAARCESVPDDSSA